MNLPAGIEIAWSIPSGLTAHGHRRAPTDRSEPRDPALVIGLAPDEHRRARRRDDRLRVLPRLDGWCHRAREREQGRKRCRGPGRLDPGGSPGERVGEHGKPADLGLVLPLRRFEHTLEDLVQDEPMRERAGVDCHRRRTVVTSTAPTATGVPFGAPTWIPYATRPFKATWTCEPMTVTRRSPTIWSLGVEDADRDSPGGTRRCGARARW